jgi:hypothetical protein
MIKWWPLVELNRTSTSFTHKKELGRSSTGCPVALPFSGPRQYGTRRLARKWYTAKKKAH